jgi:acyl-CoA thioesterase-1
MRLRIGLILFVLCAAVVAFNRLDSGSAAGGLRIMPLGDSITEGRIDRPLGLPTYRKYLWESLMAGGATADLVGSRQGVRGAVADSQADPRGAWDKDHDGHWGWRADQILGGNTALPGHGALPQWLAAADPDVVLVHLGTNDLFQGNGVDSTLGEIAAVVAAARAHDPSIAVFVSTLIPSSKEPAHQPLIDAFNAGLPGLVAGLHSAASPVVLVDNATGYSVGWNYDGVHPGSQGQQHLAAGFAAAVLARFPPTTVPPTTVPPTTTTTTVPPTTVPPTTTTTTVPPSTTVVGPEVTSCASGEGYLLGEADGDVWGFGVQASTQRPAGTAPLVDLTASPDGCGYWTLRDDGRVQAFEGAVPLDGFTSVVLEPGERFASLSATPSGQGLWGFTDRGRVVVTGDAALARTGGVTDLLSFELAGPVLDSVATPDGGGYYMLGSDGGVFAFGNAMFAGSLPALGVQPNEPAVGIVPDPDGDGYWVVAADGGVFAFDAPYRGSLPEVLGGVPLNRPIVGMVPYGDGYLQVGSDGGVFNFSSSRFIDSLGDSPPDSPVVAIGAVG